MPKVTLNNHFYQATRPLIPNSKISALGYPFSDDDRFLSAYDVPSLHRYRVANRRETYILIEAEIVTFGHGESSTNH